MKIAIVTDSNSGITQKQGEELKRTLDKMKKAHIYLSSKGREDLALWIDS